MMNVERLMENEDFVNQLSKEKTVSGIEELFKKNGVEIKDEDAKIILDGLNDTLATADGLETELTEESLDNVTGGAYISVALYILRKLKEKNKSRGGGGGGGRGF